MLKCEFNMYPLGTYDKCKQQQIQGGFWIFRVTHSLFTSGPFGTAYEMELLGKMFLFSN